MLTTLSIALAVATFEPALLSANIKEHASYFSNPELSIRTPGSNGERLAGDYIAEKLKQYGLIPAGGNGTFFQTVGGDGNAASGSRNIIGLLPGTDSYLQTQFVVLVGNYDTSADGKSPKLGTCAAAMLELARFLAESKPNKRTVVFALFSGSHSDHSGSQYWIRDSTVDRAAVDFAFEFGDLFSSTKKTKIEGLASSPEWHGIISKLSLSNNLQLNRASYDGADSKRFDAAGLPCLRFSADETSSAGNSTEPSFDAAVAILDVATKLLKLTDAQEEFLSFQAGTQITKRMAPKAGTSGDPSSGRRVRVGTIPNYSDTAGPGLLIDGTGQGSPAEKAGLRAGDRIIAWNNRKIDSVEDFNDVLTSAMPGVQVTLTVLRDGKELKLKLMPAAIG